MDGYTCTHGIDLDLYCPDCDEEESSSYSASESEANYTATPPFWSEGDDVEYQYAAGRAWCDDSYHEWLECIRNEDYERNDVGDIP